MGKWIWIRVRSTLKVYWKVNIIKNFFCCISHAPFEFVLCWFFVASIIEISLNICCAIVSRCRRSDYCYQLLTKKGIFFRNPRKFTTFFNPKDYDLLKNIPTGIVFIAWPHSESCKSNKTAINFLITPSISIQISDGDGSKRCLTWNSFVFLLSHGVKRTLKNVFIISILGMTENEI